MRYYFIAGEASGDLHTSNLVKAINQIDQNAECRGWGGDLMAHQGVEIVKHYKELAFMGFSEVLKNLPAIFKNLLFCKKDILAYKPDALILIDYPGFNLRIAKFAKKNNIKVFYYISPQIWAWKKNRVFGIKKWVHKMLVILPFEADFYATYNYKAHFVGHPLLDAIENININDDFHKKYNLNAQKQIIALLPGSRKQEIEKMLPLMLGIVPYFNDFQFVICAVNTIEHETYHKYAISDNIKVVFNDTYAVLCNAHAALVTSGTATLETALFNVPQVVCYKANKISYLIAKKLIKLAYISLVNLIMDKKVVTELIQNELNKDNLIKELSSIVRQSKERTNMLNDYVLLKSKLGGIGASKKAAQLICNDLEITK